MKKILQWLINPTKNNLRLSRLFIFAWSLVIAILLFIPIANDNKLVQIIGLDKLVHFGLFFILSYLLVVDGFLRQDDWFKTTYTAVMLSGGFAFVCEYLQKFTINRFSLIFDFFAGMLGVIVAVIVYFIFKNYSKEKLLVHICCIGCGVFVSQELKKTYRPTLYFYNPNIFPVDEYNKRLEEIKKVAKLQNLKVVIGNYNHGDWLELVRGHETDPERGERCLICFAMRFEEVAKFAKENGYKIFTSTLTVSPHKNASHISEIANELARRYKVEYLDKDFKKNDGFKKASQMSKELNLYRQDYCGCEYSIRSRQVE